MLTLIIDGAGSVEVVEFCKVNVDTAILLAWWQDQYVVWTVHPKAFDDADVVNGQHVPKWVTGTGIYCSMDLLLGRRTFRIKKERAAA